MDEKLKKATRHCVKLVIGSPSPDPTIDFKLNWKNTDGLPRNCNCGGIYTEDSLYQEGVATLYTRAGCVNLKYYSMNCSNKSCETKYNDLAKEEGIFIYMKMTCAGNEIGWDFIWCVKASKISFTCFYTHMKLVQNNTLKSTTFYGCEDIHRMVFWVVVSIQNRLLKGGRPILQIQP